VLLLVDQHGVACHTGRRSCFFRAWREDSWQVIADPEIDPEILYPPKEATNEATPAAGPIAAADTRDESGPAPSCRR
jgi:hypothetical protein